VQLTPPPASAGISFVRLAWQRVGSSEPAQPESPRLAVQAETKSPKVTSGTITGRMSHCSVSAASKSGKFLIEKSVATAESRLSASPTIRRTIRPRLIGLHGSDDPIANRSVSGRNNALFYQHTAPTSPFAVIGVRFAIAVGALHAGSSRIPGFGQYPLSIRAIDQPLEESRTLFHQCLNLPRHPPESRQHPACRD